MELFDSQYANKIWNKLYNVMIPDVLSLENDYIKTFGVRLSGDKKVDADIHKRKIHSMITVSTMAYYFNQGLPIHILKREDMVEIYHNLIGYLAEWERFIKYSININVDEYKEMLIGLDNLAKHIHQRLGIKDLKPKFSLGIQSYRTLFTEDKQTKKEDKPDYEGIRELIRYMGNRF